jgi:PAS domain S-box-containing protein
LVGASEISRDITAQKEAEAMFRLAVEASPAAMIMVDASGNIALANSETLSMFGYARGDLVGRPVEQLVPQRLRDDHSVLRRDFLAAPTRRMMGKGRELFGLRADGTEFPVEVGLSPIESPSGPMMLSVVVDITERKRAGEELARRTEDLQRSNAELQQFAYVTSHDLQEPLRMVSSFCELLKNRYGHQLEGEALEYVDFAVDGAQRMRQLINDLLDYSRLKTREVRFSAVPAKAAVESALFNLSASISETAAEIEVGELPSVSGHEGQLTHLFQNLIGNALKFRKSGEAPAVEISARRHGEAWQFTVADNGIGFDPKHADAVFGVFQRLHTRDEYPGTGIGLAMCKRIVEQHGGDIWVESSPSQGAAFHFTLMPAETISRDPATELSAETSSGSEEGSGHVRRAS